MLDIKWIRENEKEFNELLQKRGIKVDSLQLLDLDEEKRQLTTIIQQLQQAKNTKSKKLASLKGGKTKEFEEIKRDVEHINERLTELSSKIDSGDKLKNIMDLIPNLPSKDVPYGVDESMNKLIKECGEKKQVTNPKEHFDLGVALGMMDFEQTAKISGS